MFCCDGDAGWEADLEYENGSIVLGWGAKVLLG